jgi:hypothetical protein
MHKPQNLDKEISKKTKLQKEPERNKKELNNHEIEYSRSFNIDKQKDKIA